MSCIILFWQAFLSRRRRLVADQTFRYCGYISLQDHVEHLDSCYYIRRSDLSMCEPHVLNFSMTSRIDLNWNGWLGECCHIPGRLVRVVSSLASNF